MPNFMKIQSSISVVKYVNRQIWGQLHTFCGTFLSKMRNEFHNTYLKGHIPKLTKLTPWRTVLFRS